MTNDTENDCIHHSGLCAKLEGLCKRIEVKDEVTKAKFDAVNAKFDSVEKAIEVAKDTINIRLESMNEVRGQLNDQVRNFPTRIEMGTSLDKLELKITVTEKAINEKFDLILKPIAEKLSTMEACYNQKVGSRMWEIVIVTSALSGLMFLLAHFIFKF